MAGPNDVRLRARVDGNSVRLGDLIITASGGGTLVGVTLSATATVTTPAPASAGLVQISAMPARMWTAWDG